MSRPSDWLNKAKNNPISVQNSGGEGTLAGGGKSKVAPLCETLHMNKIYAFLVLACKILIDDNLAHIVLYMYMFYSCISYMYCRLKNLILCFISQCVPPMVVAFGIDERTLGLKQEGLCAASIPIAVVASIPCLLYWNIIHSISTSLLVSC